MPGACGAIENPSFDNGIMRRFVIYYDSHTCVDSRFSVQTVLYDSCWTDVVEQLAVRWQPKTYEDMHAIYKVSNINILCETTETCLGGNM